MAPEGCSAARCRRARVVAVVATLTAALNTFGSSARRSAWNARLAGVLLASTARLAAAGPANASVAPFSDDISRTRRKLTGYVFAEHVPTEFENDMHYLQDAAGADVEPCAEIKFRGASPLAAES